MSTLSRAEFIRQLADAVGRQARITGIAEDLGVPVDGIAWEDGARVAWSEVFTRARRAGKEAALRRRAGEEAVLLQGVTIAPPSMPSQDWSSDWDVGRERIEKESLRMVEGAGRTPVVLYGPRGYGRTWFLERLHARLMERGTVARVYVLRDTHFKTGGTPDEFFLELVLGLAEQAGRPRRDVLAGWREEPDLSPAVRFHDFVKTLPGSPAQRTCIIFDVPDGIWQLPPGARNDFFGKMREWKHARLPALVELRSVVAFSLTPALMNDDPNQSNLNPSPFELLGLTNAEVRALTALYGIEWSDAELAEVQRMLDGHPQYLRSLMNACRDGGRVSELLATCHEPLRLFHNELLDLRKRLRIRESLWASFKRVATEHAAPEREEDYRALLQAGLIRPAEGRRFDLRFALLNRLFDLPA